MPALRVPLHAPIQWPGHVLDKARSVTVDDIRSRFGVWELSLVGVLLLAVVLRLINLGHSYWGDEDYTVTLLRESPIYMFYHGIATSESTPPLYYVMASIWSLVLGTTEVAVRSLIALIGVATVAVGYALGLELRSRRAGLILAAFVAMSPLMVWYSQDARAYVLVILLTSVGLLFFAQALRTESSKSIWLWAFASAAALTAHYFAIFLVVPEAIALLLPRATRSRAVKPTLVVAAIWVALLPLLLYQSLQANRQAWITWLGLAERLKMTLQFFETSSWDVSFLVLAAITALIAAVIGFAFVAHRIGRRELLILVVGASGILVPVVGSFIGFDYVNYQNLLVAWMPFAAVLAVALASLRRVGAVLAVVLGGLALGATVKVQATPALHRPDWRLAAKTLSDQPANTLVVVYPEADVPALKWYDHDLTVINSGGPYVWPPSDLNHPPAAVQTRRIVLLAEDPWVYSGAHSLVLHAPAGFHQIRKRFLSTFVLVTYSARQAIPIAVNRLASMRASGDLLATTPWVSSVLFDRPPPTRNASG